MFLGINLKQYDPASEGPLSYAKLSMADRTPIVVIQELDLVVGRYVFARRPVSL